MSLGNKAPNFEGVDQNGNLVKLKDYKGKKLVLFFYPKNFTPGCTFQVCNLRDNYKLLKKEGYHILGINVDSEESHKKFIEKKSLPFTLISDKDHKIAEDYGVWKEKKFLFVKYMGIERTTFIINEEGIISNIINKVKVRDHAEQILENK